MCTNESLSRYFKDQIFNEFFVGVFAFDELSNLDNHARIIRRMMKTGSFLIYNNETSREKGEHWRLLLKIDTNHFFCFDSLGSESALRQIPPFLRFNRHLFEAVDEVQTNIQINTININYNEIEISSYVRQTRHFPIQPTENNQEFYWFTHFMLKYSQMTGEQNLLVSYNKSCFQWPNSSLCGAFACYFITLLFHSQEYRYNKTFYLPSLCRVLNFHFFDVSYHHSSELIQIHLTPFFNFVKKKLYKYLDSTAKRLFEKDMHLHLFIRNQERLDRAVLTMKTKEPVIENDIFEKQVLMHNSIRNYLKDADLLRTNNANQWGNISVQDIKNIPTILNEENIYLLEQEETNKILSNNYRRLKNAHEFLDVPIDDRLTQKEIKKLFINNFY